MSKKCSGNSASTSLLTLNFILYKVSRYKMKHKLQILLLGLCATCVGVLLGEFIIRVAFPSFTNVLKLHKFQESERGKFTRYDRLLGWDGLENAADAFEWLDTRHHVRQNRFGYRGSEYEFQRTDKRRILVLGDSFTWGFGVEDRDIFTSIIEEKLDYSVEIVNMGVSGYGNDQQYLLWREKGHQREPDDIVVMVSLFTDLWDNIYHEKHGYPKPVYRTDETGKFILSNVPVPRRTESWKDSKIDIDIKQKYWINRLYTHSAFANVFISALSRNRSIRNYLESHYVIPRRVPGFEWEYSIYSKQPKQNIKEAWTVLFKLLEMIDSDVKKKGAILWVVNIPSIVQVYPELWKDVGAKISNTEGIELDPEYPNNRVAMWCQNKNIRFIDLLAEMKDAGKTNPYLYYPLNRHWTQEGHIVAADTLLNEMQLIKPGLKTLE